MRLLANENFPLSSVLYLRSHGFDVYYIGHENKGITDSEVMQIASKEERTILTFDRDYSELIFKHNHRPQQGVIFFRLVYYSPAEPGELLTQLLLSGDFSPNNALTVIDSNSVRKKTY